MKSNFWLLGGLAGMAAASVFAQVSPRDSNAPALSPAISRGVTGPLATDVVLVPPGAATVKLESLIVRSQPAFAGDVLTHVVKGQTVTVLEQIALAKPKLNEPTNWARILLPTNTAVWVFADYVDTNSMTISRSRVNVRGGPGDFYGIVALLEKGARVKQVRRNPDWIQIEPPTNACGFVASDYLTMQPAAAPPPAAVTAVEPAAAAPAAPEPVAPPPANTTPEATNATPAAVPDATATVAAVPATPEPVAPPPPNTTPEATNATPAAAPDATATVAAAPAAPEPVAPPATNTAPETANTAAATVAPPPIVAPEPTATGPAATAANPAPAAAAIPAATIPAAATPESSGIDPKPRIVTREGYVRKTLNVQAPADYELHDISSGKLIEYLQPDAQEKNFKRFTGLRVLVTGPEALDRRWPKTPILQIQTVDYVP